MNTLKTLFLAWKSPNNTSWFPIGRLTYNGENYKFVYLQGAKKAQNQSDFVPLISFPCLDNVYTSKELFPLFANRLISSSRPDYASFIQWLNMTQYKNDHIALLGRSGGERQTDTLTIFPYPELDEKGFYNLHFFAKGLSHLPESNIQRIQHLQPSEKLWLDHEFKNSYNSQTITLKTVDNYIVGYVPYHLLSDVEKILQKNSHFVDVCVDHINPSSTPLQFRLLCKIIAKSEDNFLPFNEPEYQLVNS